MTVVLLGVFVDDSGNRAALLDVVTAGEVLPAELRVPEPGDDLPAGRVLGLAFDALVLRMRYCGQRALGNSGVGGCGGDRYEQCRCGEQRQQSTRLQFFPPRKIEQVLRRRRSSGNPQQPHKGTAALWPVLDPRKAKAPRPAWYRCGATVAVHPGDVFEGGLQVGVGGHENADVVGAFDRERDEVEAEL
ncbi:hypothetical protein ACIHEJ_37745 [Streptomyces sp. NPDC052301]|uniref:hypothetical protein n=1 Tax=Streptomyces sp. NPDC052301 TaxID=3365687 RepID=UPI0037CE6A79